MSRNFSNVHSKIILSSERDKTTFIIMENPFQNLHFFFRSSSDRLEDYALLSTITGVTAKYMKKHAETHRVSRNIWLCTVWSNGKTWRSTFSSFFCNRGTLRKRLRKQSLLNRAPSMSMCQLGLCANMLACQRGLCAKVPTCWCGLCAKVTVCRCVNNCGNVSYGLMFQIGMQTCKKACQFLKHSFYEMLL